MLLLALLAPALPLIVALAARRHPTWVPDLDLALTELRVRDVGGSHSPLVGLPGRIGTLDRQGSHPGPISFYLLAPAYRAFGATSFALQASTVLFHLAGAWTALVIVARRAGPRWTLAASLAVSVLVSALGPNLFTEPWNPHLPLLWWPAFLVAVWATLCGDVRLLPVVVVAGTICAQTHVSYLGAVGLLTILAAVVSVRRPEPAAAVHRGRWLLASTALGLVLWMPPLIDQLSQEPGNATLLAEHLLDAPEPSVGVLDGARLVLARLDVVHLVRSAAVDPGRLAEDYPTGASAWRGAAFLAAWGVAAALAWRRSRPTRAALALHVTGALGTVLAIASAARIVGFPWAYLMLWVWWLPPLLLAAAASVMHDRRLLRPVASAAMLLLVGVTLRATWNAAEATAANPVLSRSVSRAGPIVAEELDADGRYLVTWTDAINLGGFGYGMVVELERRGIEVAVEEHLDTQFGEHRVVAAEEADGHLVVATGLAIGRWARVDGAQELVSFDARTAGERQESRRLRSALIDELRARGLDDLIPIVDENLYGVAFDRRLSSRAQELVDELGALGAPMAAYLVPIGSDLP
ncbi:MAG: hypothetical protein ACOYXM_00895 [Actinomycetota bacterium]